jgi:hypothetical protein
MAALGLGDGFIAWARLLLGDTQALAVVNGFLSQPRAFAAGVRQGCPLSPLLYIVVADALQCWLEARNVGIMIEGVRRAGPAYADDTQVTLPELSVAAVQHLLDAMTVFGAASGQHLNVSKTELLPVGMPLADPPASVCGLRVVTQHKALGITFDGQGSAETAAAWDKRLDGVLKCFDRLDRLPLSVFGRAFGASGYGVSKLLYHAEYAGLPADVAAVLGKETTRLVDRGGLRTRGRTRVLPGIPSELLAGLPGLGGFGCLPWQLHINSRHAAWAAKLVAGLSTPPAGPDGAPLWLVLASARLSALGIAGVHPALLFLSAARAGPASGLLGRLPSGPLRRLAAGLASMPSSPVDVGVQQLQPGPWCAAMPLWGNPLLPPPLSRPPGWGEGRPWPMPRAGWPDGACLEDAFGELITIPTLRTVADAKRIVKAFASAKQLDWRATHNARPLNPFQPAPRACMDQFWQVELAKAAVVVMPVGMRALVADTDRAAALLHGLLSAIPVEWKQAAGSAPPVDDAAREVAASMILARLGWRIPPECPGAGGPTGLRALSVRQGTALQMGPVHALRHSCHSRFVAEALDLGGATPPEDELTAFATLLAGNWLARWENLQKETLWRMAVDGAPGGNSRVRFACPCCGGNTPPGLDSPRIHCFWTCPVACAVIREVERALPLPPHAQPLSRACMWLAKPPPAVPSLHAGVWQVVCMAALSAMEHGRRQAWRLHKEGERAAAQAAQRTAAAYARGTLLHALGRQAPAPPAPPPPPPGGGPAERAGKMAVQDFWSRLAELCALGKGLKGWRGHVGENHPFVALGPRGRMVLRR